MAIQKKRNLKLLENQGAEVIGESKSVLILFFNKGIKTQGAEIIVSLTKRYRKIAVGMTPTVEKRMSRKIKNMFAEKSAYISIKICSRKQFTAEFDNRTRRVIKKDAWRKEHPSNVEKYIVKDNCNVFVPNNLSSSVIVEILDEYEDIERIGVTPSIYKRISKKYLEILENLDIEVVITSKNDFLKSDENV